MESAKILIMMPMKHGDPTQHTFKWAQKAVKLATDFGYTVKTIEKNDVTYDNVTKTIKSSNIDTMPIIISERLDGYWRYTNGTII